MTLTDLPDPTATPFPPAGTERPQPPVPPEGRPRIGVTSPRGRGWGLWISAALSLLWYGAKPIRITAPFDAACLDSLDGLVIGGGDDIGLRLTPQERVEANTRIDPDRDALEHAALTHLWDKHVPILGICRGSQMLNLFRGGSLHQDIYVTYQGLPRIRTPLPAKYVTVERGSRLAEILGRAQVKVNALHHQSVDQVGEGMRVAARDEHGVVQAVEVIGGPMLRLGVQWHPELLLYRALHRRIFRTLVDSAQRSRARRVLGYA